MASEPTFSDAFGSFNKALEAAGLSANRARRAREQLIEQLQKKAKELGRTPTQREVKQDSEMASVKSFERTFGSFNKALKAAGLGVNITRGSYTREQLIKQLKQKAAKLGRTPGAQVVDQDPKMASARVFRTHFGSFKKALEAAGLGLNAGDADTPK